MHRPSILDEVNSHDKEIPILDSESGDSSMGRRTGGSGGHKLDMNSFFGP